MKKVVAIRLCSVLVLISLLSSIVSCSNSKTATKASIYLKTQILNYEKNSDLESLAGILCYSLNESNLETINLYAEAFLFPESESDTKILKDSFNDFCYKLNNEFTTTEITNLYNGIIWLYMYSCTLDIETLAVKNYNIIEENINAVFPKCFELLKNNEVESAIAVSAMENFIDSPDFPRDFLGVLNLFAIDKEESLTETVYFYAWEISNQLNLSPEKDFFINVVSSGKYFDEISVKNQTAEGFLEGNYTKETLIDIVTSFINNESFLYEDISKEISVLPKEFANDSYYSFHYYTKEFILSFYGSPIYCITISDMNKGCILYTTQGIDLSTVRE